MGEVRLSILGGDADGAVEASLAFLQHGGGIVLGARDDCCRCNERSSSANRYGYGNHQRRNRQPLAFEWDILAYADLQA